MQRPPPAISSCFPAAAAALLCATWAAPALAAPCDAVLRDSEGNAGKDADLAKNYQASAEHYHKAWLACPGEWAMLYFSARQLQKAGNLDLARQRLAEFLARTTDSDPKTIERRSTGKERLAQIEEAIVARDRERLDRDIKQADDHARAGRHLVAAKLFEKAYEAAPARQDLLFRAAKAQCDAGRMAECETGMKRYLAVAPKGTVEREDAETWIEDIEFARRPVGMAESATHASLRARWNLAAPPAEPKVSQAMVVTTAAAGGILALAGGGLYTAAVLRRGTLDEKLATRDANGYVSGISWLEGKLEADGIGTQKTVAVAIGSVGIAALGTAVWLYVLHKRESKVTVAPSLGPDHSGLAVMGAL